MSEKEQKKDKKANVPKLRFPGFTEPWEQRRFEEIAKRLSQLGNSSVILPSVEYEDVVSEEGILNKDIFKKAVNRSGILFSKNDVLYGKLRPYLHNWLNPSFEGVATGDWWVLKPIGIHKGFLYLLIQSNRFDYVANQSSGSKMPRADWKLVSDTIFSVPACFKEQEELSVLFTRIDHLITLHQRKLDDLKKLKKGLLQKMFPKNGEKVPELRFPGFKNDWEQCKLDEITNRVLRKNKNLESELPLTISAQEGLVDQEKFLIKELRAKIYEIIYL